MGHRVSTPRGGSGGGRHYDASARTAASLAILLATAAAATASASTATKPCCGCFVVPHATSAATGNHVGHVAAASTLLQLRATSAGLAVATVPPPNSILGRWRHQQSSQSTSSSSTLQRLEPPGTKRSQRAGHGSKGKHHHASSSGAISANGMMRRGTGLRYATHGGMHYAQYCSNSSGAAGHEYGHEEAASESSAALEKLFSTKNSDANLNKHLDMSYATTAMDTSKPSNHTQDGHVHSSKNSSHSIKLKKKGKRARMLRFLDKRLARLQFKSSQPNNEYNKRSVKSSDVGNAIDNQRRLDYEKRKAAWAAKYTSVSTLRKSFGTNKNRIWGDFDPTTTRRLYHTLLPRALLELRGLRDGLLLANSNKNSESDECDGQGIDGETEKNNERKSQTKVRPDNKKYNPADQTIDSPTETYLQNELKELAPLAYQARLAAKKYARERSRLPGRIGSMLYDGYRSWRRYGKWKSTGMTWEQVWNKYEDQVLKEAMEELERDNGVVQASDLFGRSNNKDAAGGSLSREDLDNEELTARICLRILERSVVTNDAIDKLFLERLADKYEDIEEGTTDTITRKQRRQERQRRRKLRIQADLRSIEKKFDDDIRELLRYGNLASREGEERRSRRKGGVFFWQKSDASADTVNGDHSGAATIENEDKNDPGGLEMAASAFARGGSDDTTTDARATSSTASDATATNSDTGTPSEADIAAAMFSMKEGQQQATTDSDDTSGGSSKLRKLSVHEVFALRILATTKQRITSLQDLPQLGGGGSAGAAAGGGGGPDDTTLGATKVEQDGRD